MLLLSAKGFESESTNTVRESTSNDQLVNPLVDSLLSIVVQLVASELVAHWSSSEVTLPLPEAVVSEAVPETLNVPFMSTSGVEVSASVIAESVIVGELLS